MNLLITGFAPFGGENINPSYQAVKALPDEIAGASVIKLEIPVSFKGAFPVIKRAMDQYRPQAILNVGQAGGRSKITVERIAINLSDARIPDNDGFKPQDEPVDIHGENAYFSTLPVKKIVKTLNCSGIPADLSYSAGVYVCNAVMYQVLHEVQKYTPKPLAGFIHVPYIPQQLAGKTPDTPSMELSCITDGLYQASEVIVRQWGITR